MFHMPHLPFQSALPPKITRIYLKDNTPWRKRVVKNSKDMLLHTSRTTWEAAASHNPPAPILYTTSACTTLTFSRPFH